jgi:transposase
MTTSDLYHTQGLKGHAQVGKVRCEKGVVIYEAVPQDGLIRCPKCGNQNVARKGEVVRRLRGVPNIRMKQIHFDVRVPKVRCPVCNSTRQIDLNIADRRKSYTKAFARSAVRELRNSPLSKVAETFGIDWHTAKGILQDYLAARTGPKPSKLEQIAIDGIFLGKT